MYRVIWMMKRKAGMSHAAFREHFERSHAPMAQRYAGHLFVEYQRLYTDRVWSGGDPRDPGSDYRERDWGWDLMSVWTMADEAAFHEVLRIMEMPEIRREFQEDEDRFIDRAATVMIPCVVADTGPGDGRDAPPPV